MTDEPAVTSSGFADPNRAIRMRDAIRKIAEQEVGKLTATQQVARVVSISFVNYTAQVWIPGDPEPITVNLFEDLIPGATTTQGYGTDTVLETSASGTGSLVVIDKVGGKLYVVRVLSGGQFASNLGAAGFIHKSLNALPISPDAPEQWKQSPVVSGNYGISLSLFAPANGTFAMIGPFVSQGDGYFYPGTIRVTVSRMEDTCVFESIVDAKQIEKLAGPTGPNKWMRMMPQYRGTNWREQTMQCDVGLRNTGYRDKSGTNELWIRVGDLAADADFSYVHIEAFGPMVTYGAIDTGRILIEQVDTYDNPGSFEPPDGYLGFHDSFYLYRGRQNEAGKTGPHVPPDAGTYTGASYSSGGWSSGPRVMHQHLKETWSCEGTFTWSGTNVKWGGNLTFGGIGAGMDMLPHGVLQVPMPAGGTVLPLVPAEYSGDPISVTVDGTNGIPLAAGQTLYYGIPPGMLNSGSISVANHAWMTANYFTNWHNKTWMFFVVQDSINVGEFPSFTVPEWAIPICARKSTDFLDEFQVYGHSVTVHDQTKCANVFSTTTTATFAVNTETVVQTFPTFRFKKGAAYRVRAKSGYTLTGSSTNLGMPRFQLKKGTTTGGADWGEFLRKDSPSMLSQVAGFEGEIILTNSTVADITSQFVMTCILVVSGTVPTPSPTLAMWAGANTKRYLEVEYIGPAAKYPHGVAIS